VLQAFSHCKRFCSSLIRTFRSSAFHLWMKRTPVGRSPTARLVRSSTGVGQGKERINATFDDVFCNYNLLPSHFTTFFQRSLHQKDFLG